MICDCCREEFHKDLMSFDASNRSVCPYCMTYFVVCTGCGDFCESEHIYQDMPYCYYCYRDLDFLIQGSDDDVYYRLYGSSAEGAYYGVEWEIDSSDYGIDIESSAATLAELTPAIFFKEDGSLSANGFEVITHPCTLEYHMTKLPWEGLTNTAYNLGYEHEHENCGLHIHADRRTLGTTEIEQELTIAKLMLFMDKFWADYIVPFSRRGLNRLNEWSAKPSTMIEPNDTAAEAIEKSKRNEDEKSMAINLEHEDTIEFRIFAGTLDHNEILAALQWVDTIIKHCRYLKLQDFASLTWADLFEYCEYEELNDYLHGLGL